ncbi:hypothetical protein HPB52_022713 [Rhipicephalus sanguineus]|uniref:Uncharacterized protein n=1 Tax=Rhipicephalus sanguineus TaxID=34632 RepID=A0A9D4T0V6_RHISA|nr:hypothetical protein HPB52_022713 [Rhipicephalus sanguineus]
MPKVQALQITGPPRGGLRGGDDARGTCCCRIQIQLQIQGGRTRQRGGTGGHARSQFRKSSRSKAKLTWADKVRVGSSSIGVNIGAKGPSPRPSSAVRGEDDLSDGMSDISEAPSNISAGEGNSTNPRDKRLIITINNISAALTKLEDSIAQISSRLDRLERLVAHPKTAKQAPASAAGALIPSQEAADQHRAIMSHNGSPTCPKGNSAQKDTTRDFAFLRYIEWSWNNLQEDLGSDHFITEISVSITQHPPRIYAHMNWLVFRDIRTKEERPREIFEDIISSIKAAVHKATKEIETSAELAVPAIDPTLLHSLEAINTLSGRWKKPKLSRRLRTKISELNKEIETHAKKLAAQQWDEVCKEADGTMRKGSKWSLLKNQLTDSNKPSKSSARLEIGRLMHMHTNDGDDPYTFADKLADIYIPLENKSILWDNSRMVRKGRLQGP